MAMAGGPTVRRRQLGAELRRLREHAGRKIEEVAAHLECSMSKIGRVETGQAPIKARDVRDLLGWYGVTRPGADRDRALRRPVGGPEVMAAQLAHLAEATAMPHVTIQMMPAVKGAHAAPAGMFSLLEFEGHTPTVVHVNSIAGNLYLEKERDVRAFVQTFDLVGAAAPDPQETPATLENIAREIRSR
ncbi:helix-turn-helix domain-containing protein [Streptomyces europaeiscabiei]|uniref:helix-turn-helix domain-containing protein n=1 Tax=Streptomyces europaeiscabiei TaxID=146819 RepID=UPI0038F76CB7